jgi:hypothetical protein
LTFASPVGSILRFRDCWYKWPAASSRRCYPNRIGDVTKGYKGSVDGISLLFKFADDAGQITHQVVLLT